MIQKLACSLALFWSLQVSLARPWRWQEVQYLTYHYHASCFLNRTQCSECTEWAGLDRTRWLVYILLKIETFWIFKNHNWRYLVLESKKQDLTKNYKWEAVCLPTTIHDRHQQTTRQLLKDHSVPMGMLWTSSYRQPEAASYKWRKASLFIQR